MSEVTMDLDQFKEEQQEKTYTEKEWKGLLADKTNEVRARQQAQADLSYKNNEIARLQKELHDLKTSTAEGNAGDPEDIITRAELIKQLKDLKSSLRGEYTNEKIAQSIEKARSKYTEAKAGKGLTFKDVWEGTQREIQRNPALQNAILSSKNPGEEAYRIGLQDSVIAERVKINSVPYSRNGITPKTGMGGGSTNQGFYTPEMVAKMKATEVLKVLPQIEKDEKKWKT